VRSALVLFAHGSRDPDWAAPLRAVQTKVKASRPDLAVELAFLELMTPTLPSIVDELSATGHDTITVAPLFMAQGAHVKRDLAGLIDELRRRHPHVDIKLLPAAGEADTIMNAVSAWLAANV
jgi:sirohydrochlorin cobaltochelatase